jgi:hypothetical protein
VTPAVEIIGNFLLEGGHYSTKASLINERQDGTFKKMNHQDLQDKLKLFECQRCNECCRQPGFVYLSPDEAGKAAAFMNMEAFDFTNAYCELEDRRYLVLKKNPDESCVFLSEKGCLIYPVRPQQCRDFPVGWRTPKSLHYCAGIRKLLASSK